MSQTTASSCLKTQRLQHFLRWQRCQKWPLATGQQGQRKNNNEACNDSEFFPGMLIVRIVYYGYIYIYQLSVLLSWSSCWCYRCCYYCDYCCRQWRQRGRGMARRCMMEGFIISMKLVIECTLLIARMETHKADPTRYSTFPDIMPTNVCFTVPCINTLHLKWNGSRLCHAFPLLPRTAKKHWWLGNHTERVANPSQLKGRCGMHKHLTQVSALSKIWCENLHGVATHAKLGSSFLSRHRKTILSLAWPDMSSHPFLAPQSHGSKRCRSSRFY